MSLRNWLYDYPIITILVVVWGLAIVSFATWAVFSHMPLVSAAIATCYGGVIGIPTVVVGLYQWRMGKKEEKEKAIVEQN